MGEERRKSRSRKAEARAQFPKAKLGELLSIAKLPKSTCPYCVKHPDKDAKNTGPMLRIGVFDGSRNRYGVRRGAASLRSGGIAVSNAKASRLTRKMGLRPRMSKRHYESCKGGGGKAPQLLLVEYVRKGGTAHHKSDFSCTRPDEKWTTDVSQFDFGWGKCYLSTIKDAHAGEIIAYGLSFHPNMARISRMMKRAFEAHPDLGGLIFRLAVYEREVRGRIGREGHRPIHAEEGQPLRQRHNGIVLRGHEERDALRTRGFL